MPLYILAGLAALALACVCMKLNKRLVKGREKDRILGLWQALDALEDPGMKVIQADSIFAEALKAAGYSGSLGDMLKKAGARFSNEQAVWDAHKLRNRIAHESGIQITQDEAKHALRAFWKAIQKLL